MKLNKKGLHKIQQWQSAVALGFPMRPSEIEFEPNDFEGYVCLTVEEAKDFKSYFDFICDHTHISNSMYGEVCYLRNKIWNALLRIEQTKNYDDSAYLKREIDQLKKDQTKDDWLKNQFLETVEQEKKRKSNELY